MSSNERILYHSEVQPCLSMYCITGFCVHFNFTNFAIFHELAKLYHHESKSLEKEWNNAFICENKESQNTETCKTQKKSGHEKGILTILVM